MDRAQAPKPNCLPPYNTALQLEELHMYYVVETKKPFDQASSDLEAAVLQHGFGVLHVHDLGAA